MGFPRPRILELVAISFCRGSSHPRDQTCISCLGREIVYLWATWEVQFFSRQWENLVELEGDRYNWVSLKGWIQELETGTKESRHTSPFPLCQEPDVDFFLYNHGYWCKILSSNVKFLWLLTRLSDKIIWISCGQENPGIWQCLLKVWPSDNHLGIC